jgi:hypothetical protein
MQLEELFYFYFFCQHGDSYILAETCSCLYLINKSCVELEYIIILAALSSSRYVGWAECYVHLFCRLILWVRRFNTRVISPDIS